MRHVQQSIFPTFQVYDVVKHKTTGEIYRIMARSVLDPNKYWCRVYGEKLKEGEGSMGAVFEGQDLEPYWYP